MSFLGFISDLHLGHRNILNFSGPLRGGNNIDEHDHWIVTQWNSKVPKKNSVVWVLGDVAMEVSRLELLNEMNGIKKLVRGNHDKFQLGVYMKYFQEVYGLVKHKEFWLSHAPIHPQELRGKYNIHGHTHKNKIKIVGADKFNDSRYINVCVEQCYGRPFTIEEIRNRL